MQLILRILNNFWFCIGIATFSMLNMMGDMMEGDSPWLNAFLVCIWVYCAWRTTKRHTVDAIDLTPDQTIRLNKVTRQFRTDMEAIINEDKDDGSDRGEDKKTDTKQSKDD